jgi:group I intron endonuclease
MASRSGIYAIRSESGRQYIGSAVCIKKRWGEHDRQLRTGKHHSRLLQREWDKRGGQGFRFEVLVWCDRDALLFYEQRFLDALRPEYNTAPTAGSQLGLVMSPEARARMSASSASRRHGSNFKGRKHSPESLAKLSESRKGKGCGPRPPEWRANIGKSQKGKIISVETRAKISATLTGHKQSPEQIEKRAQKLRGRKMPPGFAEAASARMLGRKPSPETLEKMRRARRVFPEEAIRAVRRMLSEKKSHRVIERETGVPRATVADISCGRKYGGVL